MKLQIVAAAAGLALAASPASAVITSITLNGNTVTPSIIAAPANVQNLAAGATVYGFNEASNILVANPRPLVNVNPAVPSGFTRIPAGTTVSSHFFLFRPTANQSASGTIVFNQNIIGVQRTVPGLTHVDSTQLRAAGTTYGLTGNMGLEGTDTLTITNAKTLTFSLAATSTNFDVFRVITSVPEPATWAMLLVGFGLVGFARRRATAVAA